MDPKVGHVGRRNRVVHPFQVKTLLLLALSCHIASFHALPSHEAFTALGLFIARQARKLLPWMWATFLDMLADESC